MSRVIVTVALAVGLTLATVERTQAQARTGSSSSWGGVDLLLHPLVQEELKLDPDQIQAAHDLSTRLLERQRVIFGQLEGLSGEDRTRKSQELTAEHAGDGMKAVATLLRPEQLSRFRQIDLQQRGASALIDPLIATPLNLSPEQVAEIRSILNHSVILMREALSSTRGDRRASTAKVQFIRSETDSQAIACLTEAQRKSWTELTGPRLELNPMTRLRK